MIYSPEMLRRIEAVTSSLRGVIRSRVDAEAGVIRRVRVVVVPEKEPERAAAEVRSALLSSLGVEVPIDEIEVTVSGPSARDEPRSEAATPAGGAPEPRAPGTAPEGGPASSREDGEGASGTGPGEARESPPGAGETPSAAVPGSPSGPAPAELPGPTPPAAPPRLRFREYAILGGRGEGVELRVRIEAEGRVHRGTIRREGLDALDPLAFVDAVLQAAEAFLDTRPAERTGRILLLEPEDVEETELRKGAFVAVTVRALLREEARRATGFAPLEGGLRESASRGALDAVLRLLDGRSSSAARGGGGSGDGSRPLDPFDVWD